MNDFLKTITNKNVLILDDEVDLCLLMKNYFLKKNCRVEIAHTVETAIYIINYHIPKIELLIFDKESFKNPDEVVKKIYAAAPAGLQIITSFKDEPS